MEPELPPANPYAKLIENYKHASVGDAQFWRAGHDLHPAINVMLPQLGLEFTNNDYVGTDPEGLFCYNDFSKIPQNRLATCLVETTKTPAGEVYVRIKFYGTNGDVCAELFASDERNAAEESGIVGKIMEGRWMTRDIGSTTAHLEKLKDESKVTLTGTASRWCAEFYVTGELVKLAINVHGELRWRDEDAIQNGCFARWDADHIVFYKSDYSSTQYTAYFMPPSDVKAAGQMPLGHIDQVFSGVKWTYQHHVV